MAISLKSTVAAPVAAYPALKSSIVLFDCNPGTRSWTADRDCTIRAFVGGAGGGGPAGLNQPGGGGGYSEKVIAVTAGQAFSYTVGAGGLPAAGAVGGTSSFGGIISATGGTRHDGTTASGGIGVGGDINTSGEGAPGVAAGSFGNAGHAFGNGGVMFGGLDPVVDGWKLGLLPKMFNYGKQASSAGNSVFTDAGMGGSAASYVGSPGIGGGGGNAAKGGPGLVGIEVLS